MTPFTFHRPLTLQDAMSLLGENNRQARVLSGGQTFLLALKERLVRPERVMSIASLPSLKGITVATTGALEIGSATTYATLSAAALDGWHSEIAAVAGNLADRSTRSLGTIGGALCDANPRYDMPTLMVAANASFTVASAAEGERVVTAQSFFDPEGGTILKPSDLLVRITIPPLSAFDGLAFEKFRHRVFDAAILTVGCAIKCGSAGKIESARVVVGNIARMPTVASNALALLLGQQPSTVDVRDVARAVSSELMAKDSLTTRQRQFQSELIISLTARALSRLTGRNGN